MSRFVKNTALNGAASVVTAVLNLLLTGILATGLTKEQFGTWAFLLILTFNQGYFGLLDGGMSVSALRSLVQSEHDGDTLNRARIMGTLRTYYLGVSLAGSLVIFAVGGVLFNAASVQLSGSSRAIVLTALSIRLLVDTLHFANMLELESKSQFGTMRLLDVVSLGAWTTTTGILVHIDTDVVSLVVAATINGMALLAVSTIIRRHRVPAIARGSLGWSPEVFRSTWHIGKWVAFQRIWSVIYSQMDRTILALLLGVIAVGDYEIPYKFQSLCVLMLSVFTSALFPLVAKFDPSIDRKHVEQIFHRGTRWTVGISLPLFVAATVMAGPLIEIWLGRPFIRLQNSVSLFLLWPMIASFHSIGGTMLSSIGKTRELFTLSSISVSLNLLASLVLAKRFGVNGVILGTIFGYIVVFIPYLRVEMQFFGKGLQTWLKEVVVPVLLPIVIQIPLLVSIRLLWENGMSAWASLALAAVVTGGVLFLFVNRSPDYRQSHDLKATFRWNS